MRPIVEYLINNHVKDTQKDVKSGNIGDRFEIDGIPCTLVHISEGNYYVISDIFTGRKGDGTKMVNVYHTNDEAKGQFATFLWSKPTKQKPEYLPEGWSFPNYDEWTSNKDITDNLKKYVKGNYECTYIMWVSVENSVTKRKRFDAYNMNYQRVEFSATSGGIRFVKIIK